MDFDHRDGERKLQLVGRLFASGALNKALAEVEKCDVVCSNCHRIRTYDRAEQKKSKLSGATKITVLTH
jgi:hypothetical protein